MAWWIWTVGGIAVYLVIGVCFGLGFCYSEGRKDHIWDDLDLIMPIPFWPVVLAVSVGLGVKLIGQFLYRRGKTYDTRKKERAERKQVEAQINDFAREHGVKPFVKR